MSDQPRSTCQPPEWTTWLKDSSCNWLEKELFEQAPTRQCSWARKIKNLQQKLRNCDDLVAVPANKTNSFRTLSKSNCCKSAEGHLTKNANEVSRSKQAEVKEWAQQMLHDKVKLGVLSNKENTSLWKKLLAPMQFHRPNCWSKTTRIPHLRKVVNQASSTGHQLHIGFPKSGRLGIKRITDNNDTNHMLKPTIKVANLKEVFENQGIADWQIWQKPAS